MKAGFIYAIVVSVALFGCASPAKQHDTVASFNEAKLKSLVGRTIYLNKQNKPVLFDQQGTRVPVSGNTFPLNVEQLVWNKGQPYYILSSFGTLKLLTRADLLTEANYDTRTSREREQEAKEAKETEKRAKESERNRLLDEQIAAMEPTIKAALEAAKIKPSLVLYTRYGPYGLAKLKVTGYEFVKNRVTKVEDVDVNITMVNEDGKTQTTRVGNIGNVAKGEIYDLFEVPIACFDNGHYFKKLPAWGAAKIKQIRSGDTWMGMTETQLIASRGCPRKRNTTSGRWGSHEQWVYDINNGPYIYLENGIVASWQYF